MHSIDNKNNYREIIKLKFIAELGFLYYVFYVFFIINYFVAPFKILADANERNCLIV